MLRARQPRMVTSWDGNPAALEPPVAGAGWRDYARLTQLLEAPVRAAGMPVTAKPVYHFSRHPQPRHAGHELRRASRLLLTARAVNHRDTRHLLELVARMVAFTEAVARLRETQHRAAQAAAARRAAEQLQHCRLTYGTPHALTGGGTPRRSHAAAGNTADAAARGR